MDLVVGLIYYPVPNRDYAKLARTSSWSPTRNPTQRPTPLPGKPTFLPTTARPSHTKKPSAAPTARRRKLQETTEESASAQDFYLDIEHSVEDSSREILQEHSDKPIIEEVHSTATAQGIFDQVIQVLGRIFGVNINYRSHQSINLERLFDGSDHEELSDETLKVRRAHHVDKVEPDQFALEDLFREMEVLEDIKLQSNTTATSSSFFSTPSSLLGSYYYSIFGSSAAVAGSSHVYTSSSGPTDDYAVGKSDDAFIPLVLPTIDDGEVFHLGAKIAQLVSKSLHNDNLMQVTAHHVSLSLFIAP